MDFDWVAALQLIEECEKQQSENGAYTGPLVTPILAESDIQLYPSVEPYNTGVVYQPDTTNDVPLSTETDFTTMLSMDTFSPEQVQQTIQEICPPTEYCQNTISQGVIDYSAYVPEVSPTPTPQQEYTLVWNSPVETQPIQQNTETALPIKVEVVGYVNTVEPAIQEPKPVTEQPKPRQKRKIKKVNVFTSQWYCEPCGRAFKSKGGLVQHNQQIHSGPTPHGCNICGKKFRDIDTMEQHRQRHLMKDKPFKCSECPKQFIRQSDLQRHIGLHHSVSPHQCDLCGRVFDRADHLTDHGLSHVNGTVKKYKGRGLA